MEIMHVLMEDVESLALCLVEECCELEECFSYTFEILGGAEDVCMQEVHTTTCTEQNNATCAAVLE